MKKENETILIVEDDIIILELVDTRLKMAGFNTLSAINGKEAIDKIKENKDISLVILDIMMPDINGLKTLEILRKSHSLLELPVLMITADDADKFIMKSFNLGANDFVNKPFNFSILIRRVETHLFIKNANAKLKNLNINLSDNNVYLESKLNRTLDIVQFSNRINKLDYDALIKEVRIFFPLVFEAKLFFYFQYQFIEKNLILVTHNSPDLKEIDPSVIIEENEGFLWDSIKKNEMIVIEDFEKSKYYEKANFFEKQIKSNVISIPVIVEGKIYGAVALYNIKNEFMNQEHLTTINLVMNQFSLAVNNALLHNRVKELSVLDELTKLYNRRYFNKMINIEIERANRNNTNLSIIMLDIDYFKRINDVYGHDCGDIILKDVSDVLKNSLRNIDIIFRCGGEEFIIVLPTTEKKFAVMVAERIRKRIMDNEFLICVDTYKKINITVSLGVTQYIVKEENRHLLKRVDEALYMSKNNGRNLVTEL